MERLIRSGVVPIRLDDALKLLDRPVHTRYACITFDDGYRDFLDHALPVLEDLGVPATVFAVSGILDGNATFEWYDDPPQALTWADLPRIIHGGLVDVQAHSRTHRRMPRLTYADLYQEVAGAKEELERHLPYRLTSFSYPAGLYTEREMKAVAKAGFQAGVTTRPGVNPGGEGLGELRRTMVRWRDSERVFDAKLRGALDRPSRLTSVLQARRAAA
jgi:peptidoglycan/xylan/chitin deacetylase (PgdA/CDA1 family)